MPLGAHIKEHPAWFKQFEAIWTPTVVVLNPNGEEVWRVEGYLPKDEFQAHLMMALGRVAAMHKKWDEAEKWYARVVETYPQTSVAPEAMYWRNVSVYNRTHEAAPLQQVAKELKQKYPESIFTKKASVWAA